MSGYNVIKWCECRKMHKYVCMQCDCVHVCAYAPMRIHTLACLVNVHIRMLAYVNAHILEELVCVWYSNHRFQWSASMYNHLSKQGKSEAFDSCDRPCDLAQIRSNSIFQPVWPWNLTDDLKNSRNLFHAPRSYGCYFIAIHEFKLEL